MTMDSFSAVLESMFDSHPRRRPAEGQVETVRALVECAQVCNACAEISLAEADVVALTECVRRCLDCAEICTAAAQVLTRGPSVEAYALLNVAAQMCRRCADECGKHAGHHEHCRICMTVCLSAERACWEFVSIHDQVAAEGVPAIDLSEEDLRRELAQLHRTRDDTLLHAAESALERHTARQIELEVEYVRRHPDREVERRRTRAGARS